MLEAISLAYGLKTFAPYILNCQGKVKIFTDAKALIYAKRQSTHSILLNSTINYLSNIVSLVNVCRALSHTRNSERPSRYFV